MCQAKAELLQLLKPELAQKKPSKKRKRAEFEEDETAGERQAIIEEFS